MKRYSIERRVVMLANTKLEKMERKRKSKRYSIVKEVNMTFSDLLKDHTQAAWWVIEIHSVYPFLLFSIFLFVPLTASTTLPLR